MECGGWVTNKDKEFWEATGEWEDIILLETWIEEKGWSRIKNRLPTGYKWRAHWAKKKNKKGRAMGGMMIGVREEMMPREE